MKPLERRVEILEGRLGGEESIARLRTLIAGGLGAIPVVSDAECRAADERLFNKEGSEHAGTD